MRNPYCYNLNGGNYDKRNINPWPNKIQNIIQISFYLVVIYYIKDKGGLHK